MRKLSCWTACVVLVINTTLAGQTVVVNDNIEFVPESFVGANHRGSIQQVAAGDVTSVWFDYDGNNLTAVTWNIDEESDWYVVDPGDPFGFSTLASGRFTPIFTVDNPRPPVFVGSNEFYLGVSTTSTNGEGITEPYCSPNDFLCRNVFGWVRLRNVFGQLEMVENAVAYGSLGIIVGTTDLVPEPQADFDKDGDVDGDDFLVWQVNFPAESGASSNTGDADSDGDVDGDDFLVWQIEAGSGTGGETSAAAPEPTGLVHAVLIGLVCVLVSSRKDSHL